MSRYPFSARGRRKGGGKEATCLVSGTHNRDEAGGYTGRYPLSFVTDDAPRKEDDEEKGGEEGEERKEGEHRSEERVHSEGQEVKGERCRSRHASERGRCQAF